MTKILKSNKIITSLLIILCIFFIFNPKVCSNSCLNAISVWAYSVVPVMFPFFILTRLIVEMNDISNNHLDKFFSKTYHCSNGSLNTFFLSALSGYPMGAKIISAGVENGNIDSNQAKKMMSFCSISGPMFIIGTVGIAFLNSYISGIIILISNISAALANGLIYRGKTEKFTKIKTETCLKKDNLLSSVVYDSLISILMVGSFIVFSFILIDALKSSGVLHMISNTISCVSNNTINADVVESILCGFFEMTRGIKDLSATNLSLELKTILSCGMVGFGGLSVMMQSLCFLKTINMRFKTMLIQKFTHCILSLIFCIFFIFIIF